MKKLQELNGVIHQVCKKYPWRISLQLFIRHGRDGQLFQSTLWCPAATEIP